MSTADIERGGSWSARSIYLLAILTLISTLNYFDRSVMSLVLPLIKAEFKVKDTTLGAITSLILFYAVFGVPIAWLAERWSRRNVMAIGLSFWSLMTVLTGFAGGVGQLAVCRFLMGVGEGCGFAPAQSLVGDTFSRSGRALALSILTTASSISLIVYSPIAGWVAGHYGWRATFFLAGAPGLVLAAVFMLTVKEPRHAATTTPRPSAPLGASLRFLLGSRAYVLCLLGTALMGVYLYGISAWGSMFFVRVRHLSIQEVGAYIQPTRGLMSAIGIVIGGVLASRLELIDIRWRCWVAGLSCLILAPFEALYIFGGPTLLWAPAFVVAALFSIMHQGPIYSAYLGLARPRMGAISVSVALLSATVIGQLGGPILIGRLNDVLHARFGEGAIRYSMLVVIGCAVLGGLCFLAAGRYIAADTRRASEA